MNDKTKNHKDFSELYTLSELNRELFKNSNNLNNYLSENSNNTLNDILINISELYTDFKTFQLALLIYGNAHYELTSLLSFWENFYNELCDIAINKDSNTTWLSSTFKEYKNQFELVDTMLSENLNNLKELL